MFVQLESIYPREFCLQVDSLRGTWFDYVQRSESCKLSVLYGDSSNDGQSFIALWLWPLSA
jgi:hypothetical protein